MDEYRRENVKAEKQDAQVHTNVTPTDCSTPSQRKYETHM
jgi:hypothetical protein